MAIFNSYVKLPEAIQFAQTCCKKIVDEDQLNGKGATSFLEPM